MQKTEILENGLAVIVEEMPHVESVAYELQIPGGIICDDDSHVGAALILAELTSRGAGDLSSRQLSDKFEELGIRHIESAGFDRYVYRGSLFASNLGKALELVSLMVRDPVFPEEEIPNISSVLLQDIAALKDSPARLASQELHKRYYPEPYARSGLGEESGINAVTRGIVKDQWSRQYLPHGSILSIAGGIKRDQVMREVRKYFEQWTGECRPLPEFGALQPARAYHIDHDSAQSQILLSFPSARFCDQGYYPAKVVTGILSGGMFGRLFIEVREKRGLCYSVYARHSATNDYGTMTAYAGTTPERAHETLKVMLEEFRGLAGSLNDDELKRSKANLKSSVVMGEESSSSRAGSNAGDWWLMKRVRTLDEIISAVDGVTIPDIDSFFKTHPVKDIRLLTLGKHDLSAIYGEIA